MYLATFFANHKRGTVWHSKSFANIAKMFIMTAMLNMQFGSPQQAGGHFATSTYQRTLFRSKDMSVIKNSFQIQLLNLDWKKEHST